MRRDPFLNRIYVIFDRLSAWLWLVVIIGALLWSATWQNGLQLSGEDAARQFIRFVTGGADRTTSIISILILANAVMLASLISVWLFRRWQHSSEFGVEHIRGSRLRDGE